MSGQVVRKNSLREEDSSLDGHLLLLIAPTQRGPGENQGCMLVHRHSLLLSIVSFATGLQLPQPCHMVGRPVVLGRRPPSCQNLIAAAEALDLMVRAATSLEAFST